VEGNRMRVQMRLNSHAQASIETLLVFLIFISAFSIVYVASSRLAASAQSRLDTSLSQSSFTEFAAKLQSACSMGNGNIRTVEVRGNPASLFADGNSIVFTAGSFSARANSSCELSLAASSPARFFRIENNNGTLLVSPEAQQ